MFFGIGCQEMTLEDIGDKICLTKSASATIKEKAIRRLSKEQEQVPQIVFG